MIAQILLIITSVDNVLCIDACFTQKRRHGPEDPHHLHPGSVFLTDKEVKAMEDFVKQQRPSEPSQAHQTTDNDGFEPSMQVPISVLNDCENSFKAADERRVKASTQFFSDTGLMALLCRHDRVLWLANMTSPGERQYYALALINKLFEHLPLSMRVGLLYDIGCKLHRSCLKWGFLSDFLDRLTFGISVFHAYGHQWPCQLIYHPRKCVGFGLTDGEGCERFWSSIKQLIPSLRVSGVSFIFLFMCNLLIENQQYYHRLYVINSQVRHLDTQSLEMLGAWLQRKWNAMNKKKMGATSELEKLEISETDLRVQWKEQVVQQTRPLTRKFSLIEQ
jgi:hypothetical protein